MNAQDDQPAPHDASLLALVDRVLAEPDSAAHHSPDSLETFCSNLGTSAPQADPAFQELLGRRLTDVIERRQERSVRARAGSFARTLRTSPRSVRRRLVPVALAVLVAAGGIGTYLHSQSTTPVSAQTVLQRAAAVSPGPNAATHSNYRLSATGGITGTADLWVGTDTNGIATDFALTQTVSESGRPAPNLSGRLVQNDREFQVYDPATNTITTSSQGIPYPTAGTSSAVQNLEGILIGTFVAQKLNRALAGGMLPNAWKMQQETLNGVSVYALRLEGQTFYFNTQSYVLEGADWAQGGQPWQARLDHTSSQSTPLSAVPAHTFTLNAPAGARVVTLAPSAGSSKHPSDDKMVQTAAAACGTTPDAMATALRAGDKSMLAICQVTAPTMTADALVNALMAPLKADLDAQVASGALTREAETSELANLRTKLTAMVTGQPGAGTGAKKP
jgi:hypothetical protein